MENTNRFNLDGTCRCAHIKSGGCEQCCACNVCDYYREPENTETMISPWQYVWGGQIRDSRANSMCARPYYRR